MITSKNHNTGHSHYPDDRKEARAQIHQAIQENKGISGWTMFYLLLIALILCYLVMKELNDWYKSEAPKVIGTVQRTNYVGGFGERTQIDTEGRPYLVVGAVYLKPGTALTQVQNFFDTEICVAGTKSCWRQIGE